ncbi:hypothetical protein ACFYUL_23890 [Streptomyces sp. NPDC004311]|uniref:hypothetical protein n=1 Tax=Streptomyces sp. NPDC004311 TaxID=3364698 RepID=UPI0036A2A16A
MAESSTEPRTYQALTEELPLRAWGNADDPEPVEDCAGCLELAAVRDRAYAVGDMTTVTDCNIYIRRHPIGH